MNPLWSSLLAASIPTVAVLVALIRNETSLSALAARVTSLEQRIDARIETLDRDLRDWAKITMAHNSDIARLKDKAALD